MEMFISDTHFGHENILDSYRPGFASIDAMDETIIDNINRRMKKNDILYIAGDFCYRSRRSPLEYLNAIKPKKVLLIGNHDRDWLKRLSDDDIKEHFIGVHDRLFIKRGGIELHLNHFPALAWNRSHYFAESFSICGHIHSERTATLAAQLFPLVKTQLNAGVDVNNFEPVTFAELVRNNTLFYGRSYTDDEQVLMDRAIERVMSNTNTR